MSKKISHDENLPPVQSDKNVAHTTDRLHDFEVQKGGNIARTSSVPKRTQGVVPVNGGMHFRDRDGNLNVGITHQQVVNAPDASGARPLDPTVSKRYPPTMVTPGMRSRITDTPHAGSPGENHARARANPPDPYIGQQILQEAHADKNTRDALAHLTVGINPFGRK